MEKINKYITGFAVSILTQTKKVITFVHPFSKIGIKAIKKMYVPQIHTNENDGILRYSLLCGDI